MAPLPGHPLTRYEAGLSRRGGGSRAAGGGRAATVPCGVGGPRAGSPWTRRRAGRDHRPVGEGVHRTAPRRGTHAGVLWWAGRAWGVEAFGTSESLGILGGMGSLAVIPTWVVPPAQQVVDCFRICYAVVDETLSFLRGGHAAAVNWVTGGQVSPISELTEPHLLRKPQCEGGRSHSAAAVLLSARTA